MLRAMMAHCRLIRRERNVSRCYLARCRHLVGVDSSILPEISLNIALTSSSNGSYMGKQKGEQTRHLVGKRSRALAIQKFYRGELEDFPIRLSHCRRLIWRRRRRTARAIERSVQDGHLDQESERGREEWGKERGQTGM